MDATSSQESSQRSARTQRRSSQVVLGEGTLVEREGPKAAQQAEPGDGCSHREALG